jgi:glycine/serine hydroxymethyltransferase
MTTRGLKETEFKLLANLIHELLSNPENTSIKKEVKVKIEDLTNKFELER